MIDKPGTVTITEDKILIEHFHFSGGTFPEFEIEALEWAVERIAENRPSDVSAPDATGAP